MRISFPVRGNMTRLLTVCTSSQRNRIHVPVEPLSAWPHLIFDFLPCPLSCLHRSASTSWLVLQTSCHLRISAPRRRRRVTHLRARVGTMSPGKTAESPLFPLLFPLRPRSPRLLRPFRRLASYTNMSKHPPYVEMVDCAIHSGLGLAFSPISPALSLPSSRPLTQLRGQLLACTSPHRH